MEHDDIVACPIDENIILDKRPFTTVQEGKANVEFPSSLDVFYNPVQEFNRDLSVAVLRLFASDYKLIKTAKNEGKEISNKNIKYSSVLKIKEKDYDLVNSNTTLLKEGEKDPDGITILEALGASGLRSLRYAKEIGGVNEICTNDYSKSAVECMTTNIIQNNVQDIITPSHNDASLLMYQHRHPEKQYTAVDLDPYGSPHTFLDGAVQSVVDGGLLLVTCTDMGVLCGKSPETCFTKYGSLSINLKSCHEMALRIVLRCIESNANKYGRYIVPLISMSADFYCRVFVRVFTSSEKCKETYTKLSYVHYCTSCGTINLQRLGEKVVSGKSIKYQLSSPAVSSICAHCGGKNKTGGPMWTAPIHDQNFLKRLLLTLPKGGSLNTVRRIEGTLNLMAQELPDVPLYFAFDKLFKVVHMHTIKMKEFASALLNAGYKVSRTHAAKTGLKTDAPNEFIWEIMRALNKRQPVELSKYPPYDPVQTILAGSNNNNPLPKTVVVKKEIVHTVSFDIHPDAELDSVKKFLRFQVNPERNWGPKAKAVTSLFHGNLEEKRKLKQNKRKRKVNDTDCKKRITDANKDDNS